MYFCSGQPMHFCSGVDTFAIDASLIKADANRQKGIEGEKGLPPEATGRAVAEYMRRYRKIRPLL
jgi:hypothetical protein